MADKAQFGMIGLAVMGQNLALNVEEHGFSVAVWNLETDWVDRFVSQNPKKRFVGTKTLESFVASLEKPRRIMMMIKAGAPVDITVEKLLPLVEPGDIIIDGGNSWFEDTRKREALCAKKGVHFLGVGVSGGEEGARHGPSMMPGGNTAAYERVRPVFEAIAAKTESGACVTHVGPDGAGHFVKMVHNGIEYADMQLIAESYDLLRRCAGLDAAALAKVYGEWNQGPLGSFLIELTSKVFQVRDPETSRPLVDLVLDKAGQKGTGKWTAQVALDLAVPIPSIAAAIDARVVSSMKDERTAASKALSGPKPASERDLVASIHDALHASKIVAYAQGMSLIRTASKQFGWKIDLREMARIWKGGCIIRAKLLDAIMGAFAEQPELPNLLVAPAFRDVLAKTQAGWRRAVAASVASGVPVPALAASLAYFDSYRTAQLPQNLTQAQRDAFGSHTYERADHPERGFVHTDWLGLARGV